MGNWNVMQRTAGLACVLLACMLQGDALAGGRDEIR